MTGEVKTAVIILAAGAASRMGRPKQLLQVGHQSLIRQAVDTAIEINYRPVVVVLGAYAASVQKEIRQTSALPVVNEQWQEGMGSSVRAGIQKLREVSPEAEAAIIMLCDQPLVTPALLQELLQAHKVSGKPIVASRYKDTLGVPALFHRSFFQQLQDLPGDVGARKLIRQHADQIAEVSFEYGAIDLDTPEDYEKFSRRSDV